MKAPSQTQVQKDSASVLSHCSKHGPKTLDQLSAYFIWDVVRTRRAIAQAIATRKLWWNPFLVHNDGNGVFTYGFRNQLNEVKETALWHARYLLTRTMTELYTLRHLSKTTATVSFALTTTERKILKRQIKAVQASHDSLVTLVQELEASLL